ncbi:MAG: hypothetical protein ABIJ56_24595 [Pseudomonadota bacterium]
MKKRTRNMSAIATALIIGFIMLLAGFAGCASGDNEEDGKADLDIIREDLAETIDSPGDTPDTADPPDDDREIVPDGDDLVDDDGGPDGVEDAVEDDEADGDMEDVEEEEVRDPWEDRDGDTIPPAGGDCDDDDPDVYPGAEDHIEGVDYNCDTLVEYEAIIMLAADDEYDLCVNGEVLATGIGGHGEAETYELILHAGPNVIGVHGYDTSGVTAGMCLWARVAGKEIKSDGVLVDEDDTTPWRYFPSEDETPQATWCDVGYDDTEWGPALFNAEQDDGPWLAGPTELRGTGVEWIWDGRPRDLEDAWFRRMFTLPNEEPPVAEPGTDVCTTAGDPVILIAGEGSGMLHNGVTVAWTGSRYGAIWDQYYAAWRDGVDELFIQMLDGDGSLIDSPVRLTTYAAGSGALWWNTFPDVAWGDETLAIVNQDGRHNRDYDQVYLVRADSTGAEIEDDVRVTSTSTWAKYPVIDFDGENFGVAWQDDRDGGAGAFEIYFTRLSPDGDQVGTQLRLTDATNSSRVPTIAWGASQWGVAWEDIRDGSYEIYFTRVSSEGAEEGDDIRVTTDIAVSSGPSLAWSGTGWGLAWEDEIAGNREIYFTTVAPDGTVASPVRVTEDGAISSDPVMVWDDGGWAIAWRDARDGNHEIYAARIDAAGSRLSDDSRLTESDGHSWNPDLVWTGSEYGLMWEEETEPVDNPYYFRASFVRFTCP